MRKPLQIEKPKAECVLVIFFNMLPSGYWQLETPGRAITTNGTRGLSIVNIQNIGYLLLLLVKQKGG
jgi:hypothetical protein